MGFKHIITKNLRFINWNNNLLTNRCANSVFEFHSTGVAQKVMGSKLEFPQKPKKPNPPFFQFLQEKRPEISEKHNLNPKDAMRVLSNMWKNFDVYSKTKMIDSYSKELEQYKESLKAYKESLTDDQKNELFRIKYEQSEYKMKRKLKKELKELGKPRKPLTAYLLFVTEEIQNRGNVPVQTYMATVASKWKEMDINSKKKYIDAASMENDNYKNLLYKWEDDMIKAGRFDLVRARSFSTANIE